MIKHINVKTYSNQNRGLSDDTTLGYLHCKKKVSRMSLLKLSLAGNNLIFPGQGEFGYSDVPAGEGKNRQPFFTV
jgi:hypothetical protein